MGRLLRRIKRNEEGQSLVELALVLPILLLILLGIIQFGFVLSGQIAVSSAAREGARLAAIGAADPVVRERVENMLAASPLLNAPQVVIVPAGTRVFGEQVSVQVLAGSPTVVPLPVGPSGGVFNLSAEAVMRVENVGGGN